MINLHFYLRFHTEFGQTLWITGNTEELGMDEPMRAVPMTYLNDQYWEVNIGTVRKDWPEKGITYKYFLRNKENEVTAEWGRDRLVQQPGKDIAGIQLHDTWNHAGEYENAFFTAPFNNVLLKPNHPRHKDRVPKTYTHIFRVKAPLLEKHEVVCLSGGDHALGDWEENGELSLSKEGDWWTAYLDLSKSHFPLAYKYGVYNSKEERFIRFEDGDNRFVQSHPSAHDLTVIHDGFIHLPNNTWKGAGVSIPVFSLRSKKSFGVGEFTDLKLLVDWANETNLKLIQILPVNDTTATHTWVDSYPYAAISAFALHPLYINLETCA
ncbi:MAG: 4-alpha-glucanotransferase, partial [Chitinophagaceae bacterium]